MIANAFQEILGESSHKSNKKWVDKGRELMKSWLQDNDIEVYLTITIGNLLFLKDLLEL